MLEEFFISKVRVNILDLFLKNSADSFYVRQIARKVGTEINAARRELDRLTKIKLLKRVVRGNRVFYQLRPEFVFVPELLGLIHKNTGLGSQIIKKSSELGRVDFAVLTHYFIWKQPLAKETVDLALVGKINLKELTELIEKEQVSFGREINYAVISPEDFSKLKSRRDHFVYQLLLDTRVVLVGDESAFKSKHKNTL